MNKLYTKTLKVGQTIFICRSYGAYHLAVVKKVTPAGMIDVGWDNCDSIQRFRANGREQGAANPYRCDELDTMPFAERKEWLASQERAKAAAEAINSVKCEHARHTYGKESLANLVAGLQKLVDDAKAKVDAI